MDLIEQTNPRQGKVIQRKRERMSVGNRDDGEILFQMMQQRASHFYLAFFLLFLCSHVIVSLLIIVMPQQVD